MRIAIIGSAGRDKDAAKFTRDMFEKMVEHVQQLISREEAKEICLVSGGSSWSDHVAVALFLRGKVQRLEIHLPCGFDANKRQFCKSPIATTLNRLHCVFSKVAGIDSLGELRDALCAFYCQPKFHRGFYARNVEVGRSVDLMVAFSWSEGDHPVEGGTAYTWNRCRAARKVHVPLCQFLSK